MKKDMKRTMQLSRLQNDKIAKLEAQLAGLCSQNHELQNNALEMRRWLAHAPACMRG